MRSTIDGIGIVAVLALAANAALAADERSSISQGPEAVFDRGVAEILPALAGAKATGENGRIGNELAFWGYELADGSRAFFYACAMVANVDCGERATAICRGAEVRATGTADGKIVHRQCAKVAVAQPGEVRPGCEDQLQIVPLEVGVVQCP